MNAYDSGPGPRHIHDIELDNAVPVLGVAGARASGADSTSASHLLRPERASEESRPPVITTVSTGEEASSDDTTSAYHLLRPDHASGETKIPSGRSRVSRSSKRAGWTSSWIYEICAIVVSVAFMIAIVVVLALRIDRKPRDSWTLPLAPNTVIALFSTLSKSAILLVITACISQLKWIYFGRRGHRLMDLQIFDSASRGPLGAISLIFHIRWGATIASFGALLTIFALFQDAFYQQIYSTYTNPTHQQGNVSSLAVTRCQDTGTLDSGYTSE
jgi:hypothetical protein